MTSDSRAVEGAVKVDLFIGSAISVVSKTVHGVVQCLVHQVGNSAAKLA